MATGEDLIARALAVRNRVFARLSLVTQKLQQWRLAAGAVGDDIWREGTMGGLLILRMTHHGTFVDATVKLSLADVPAVEGSLKPGLVGRIERGLDLVLLITG
jgi:hypothetical protein